MRLDLKGRFALPIAIFPLVVSIVAIVAAVVYFARETTYGMFPWLRGAYSSDSMEPADIYLGKLGDVHLKMPRAYISTLQTDEKGNATAFQIEAYLPDMIPKVAFLARHPTIAARDPQAIAELRKDWLFITLYSTSGRGREGFDAHLDYYRQNYKLRDRSKSAVDYDVYDFFPYESKYNSKAKSEQFYVPYNNRYNIGCIFKFTSYYVCHLHFFVKSDTVDVQLSFNPETFDDSEIVPRGHEIMQAVTAFLLPKIVDPKQ